MLILKLDSLRHFKLNIFIKKLERRNMADYTKRFYDIDNDNCILVEFINEDNKIQIGYSVWLENIDLLLIEDIISDEEEITVNWPNCDILSAQYMKKKLQNATFKKYPVRLLAHGKWTELKTKEKDLIKYGMMNPSKHIRHQIAKKPTMSDSDEDLFQVAEKKDEDKTDIGEKHENEKEKDLHLIKEIKSVLQENDKINYSNQETESNGSVNSTNSDYELTLLEEKDRQIKDLSEQIKNLEGEIVLLKNNLSEIGKREQELRDKNVELTKTIEKIDINTLNAAQTTQFSIEIKDVINDTSNFQSLLKKHLRNFEKIKSASEASSLIKENVEEDVTNSNNDLETSSKLENINVNKDIGGESPDMLHKNSEKVKRSKRTFEKTSYVITKEQLRNVDKSNINTFTNDILTVLFNKEELASCSVTGKQSNANKDREARPPLDPERLNAARNLCYQLFPKHKDWKTKFNYIARNKCSDARKNL